MVVYLQQNEKGRMPGGALCHAKDMTRKQNRESYEPILHKCKSAPTESAKRGQKRKEKKNNCVFEKKILFGYKGKVQQ